MTSGESIERQNTREVRIGSKPLRIEDVNDLARGVAQPRLDPDPSFRLHLTRSRETLEKCLAAGKAIYGVTTGVGASVVNEIPHELREKLPHNLLRFHGCGTGRILDETAAAGVVAVRLISLARGYSGVRIEVIERLCELLKRRILPRIPEEGSVGASGDLTPLSYLAATLVGEREVSFGGEVLPAQEALARAGLEPLQLGPKESLAIMNGTGVMTALACVAFERARALARLSCCISAMNAEVMRSNRAHFDARIFELKPHPGQTLAARWIREDLEYDPEDPAQAPARLQDRYSIRCAPHIIGVLVDALLSGRTTLEIELNGVDDNPLVDADHHRLLHGGNFYGGHVCFVMDGLKNAIANIADLLDRQLALLCCPTTSAELPANLVTTPDPDDRATHHGFKAMQISASALTAEALKLAIPASIFSRSTESHNQDKVSMGTIAARDCLRILELTETVAAIVLLAACQAYDLREREGDGVTGDVQRSRGVHAAVRDSIPMVIGDRRQDRDIERLLERLRSQQIPFGTYDDI